MVNRSKTIQTLITAFKPNNFILAEGSKNLGESLVYSHFPMFLLQITINTLEVVVQNGEKGLQQKTFNYKADHIGYFLRAIQRLVAHVVNGL